MSQRIGRAQVLALVIPVFLFVPHGSLPADSAPALTIDVLSATFGSLSCVNQFNCSGGKHRMEGGTPWGEFAPDYHPCNPPAAHYGPLCGNLAFSPDRAVNASASDLKEMLSAPNTNLSLNRDRRAVQLSDCDGLIVLSIPVDHATLGYLDE